MLFYTKPSLRTKVAHSWLGWAFFFLFLALVPLFALVFVSFESDFSNWSRLFETILLRSTKNSLYLLFLTLCLACFYGCGSAWLISFYRFPGSRVYKWALLLPLAFPTYVVSYMYADFFEYAGPFQKTLRHLLNFQAGELRTLFDIRSLYGGAFVFAAVLYPYVYMMVRISLLQQSMHVFDAARLLNVKGVRRFFLLDLPLIRPALAVGVALVSMEVLADFGTVEHYGIMTFSLAIVRTWQNRDDLSGALQIAFVMLLFILFLVLMEEIGRKKQRHTVQHAGSRSLIRRKDLFGRRAWGASLFCFFPIFFGFLLPFVLLLKNALSYWAALFDPVFWKASVFSFGLALSSACLITGIGFFVVYTLRLSQNRWLGRFIRLSMVGYAVPGTILAVGLFVAFARLDNVLNAFLEKYFSISIGLLISGSVALLFFAYLTRFLAISIGGTESAFKKLTPRLDDAAKNLGASNKDLLFKVHFPLLKGALLSVFLLIFVDVMKELPATLLAKPAKVETLATYVYQKASQELYEQMSLAALAIVVLGIIPIFILFRNLERSHKP